MKSLIFPIFDETGLTQTIQEYCNYEIGELILRDFPDGETYLRFISNLKNRPILLISNLNQPNPKILTLLLIAKTARDLGASKIGLITPYLPYMRQDKIFYSGEGLTSRYFAQILSENIDYLATVDPHLHRWHSLNNIYNIPTQIVHAHAEIATWIKNHVANPLIIGPDQESEQWVAEISKNIHAKYIIAEKTRISDEDVKLTLPTLEPYLNYTPVLVDDIISTGNTLIKTAKILKSAHMQAPICIAIHGIFSLNAYENLIQAGIKKIITCNTIHHSSNEINLNTIIAQAVQTTWEQIHRKN